MWSGENGIFLTSKLLCQIQISGGKAVFQYLIGKRLVSPVLLIEALCVLGQICYISFALLCTVWPLPLFLPLGHFCGYELSCAGAQKHHSSAVRLCPSSSVGVKSSTALARCLKMKNSNNKNNNETKAEHLHWATFEFSMISVINSGCSPFRSSCCRCWRSWFVGDRKGLAKSKKKVWLLEDVSNHPMVFKIN